MDKKQHETIGICESCKDEYDEPKPKKLFRSPNGSLICGSCMAEGEGDAYFHELAYGRN